MRGSVRGHARRPVHLPPSRYLLCQSFQPASRCGRLSGIGRTYRCLLTVLVLAPDLYRDAGFAVDLRQLGHDTMWRDEIAAIDRVNIANRDFTAVDPGIAK